MLSVPRPPSQSLNSYGHSVHDDVRSPTGSTGTPGPLSQQPSSQQSTDNNSEAGYQLKKENAFACNSGQFGKV
ncbi:Homeobox protein Meis2 [Tyrophagus putrescentiae]|nr:Homeobox protein Meis2 [Tyrophagus putrescentiae]